MKKLITKGNWFYEIQILMIVFMWQHTKLDSPKLYGLRLGPLHIWIDTAWCVRGKIADLAKPIFRVIKFFRSLIAYLRLNRDGFEISYWSDPDLRGRYKRYRFFWRKKLIREMPDIVCVDGNYSTVNNGHQEQLGIHMWIDDFKNFVTNEDNHDI